MFRTSESEKVITAETKQQQSQKEHSRTQRKYSVMEQKLKGRIHVVLEEGDVHIRKSMLISTLMFKMTANKILLFQCANLKNPLITFLKP